MMDFLDKVANSDLVLTSLVIALIVLVTLFFIVLFLGGKKQNKKEIIKEEKFDDTSNSANLDFDHEEYVKETTAEFELAPVEEAVEASDEVSIDSSEESPAYNFEDMHGEIENKEMNNFSFDELSKMISDELEKNNIEEENTALEVSSEEKEESNIPEVTFVDTFKEVEEEIKPVEFSKLDNIGSVFEKEEPSRIENVLIDKKVAEKTNDEIVLPKLASDIKEEVKLESEPVIKDEATPLYARFNQETYEIDKKD